jgi:protein ImuB
MRRPLSLLAEPIPLAVAFEKGPFRRLMSSSRLPSRIHLDGVIHQIARDWGPERIETGWWKGPSIRRDYYRIETDQGRWWWIFRNLVSKAQASDTKSCYCWMLHGRFA